MASCGCSIRRGKNNNANEDRIQFCSKHDAVDDLLTAAKDVLVLVKAETKLTAPNKKRAVESISILEAAIQKAG